MEKKYAIEKEKGDMKKFVIKTNEKILKKKDVPLSAPKNIEDLKCFGARFSRPDWEFMVKNEDFMKALDSNDLVLAEKLAKKFLCKI